MKTKIYNLFYALCAIFLLNSGALAQDACTSWTSPSETTAWTDFGDATVINNSGGCDTTILTGFQVWASEAYLMPNVIEGISYTFSACGGSQGAWVPDFTIIAPSGAIDAFGLDTIDNCSITWTASESGEYTVVVNEAGQCGGGDNTDVNNGFPAITCSGLNVLSDTCAFGSYLFDTDIMICDDVTQARLVVDSMGVPSAGGLAFQFIAGNSASGAIDTFAITGASNPFSFDSDINGILSANGLMPLSGEWILTGFVYSDTLDVFGSVCSLASEVAVVSFGTPPNLTLTEGEFGTATVSIEDGFAPYDIIWSTGDTTEMIADTINGLYEVTVTDALGCSSEGTVTITTGIDGPCVDFQAGPFGDFNTFFGGAPTFDEDGNCVFNEIQDFQVWASEAYSVDGFIANIPYTFSMCGGDGAGSWVPEFTIIDPDGEVFLTGVGNGDSCSITWTPDVDGTYVIIINELDSCGGGSNTSTNNGFPALSCGDVFLCGNFSITAEHTWGGNVNVAVEGGVEPYSYLWSDGSVTDSVSGLDDGTYTVSVTDGNGCVREATVEVMITSVQDLSMAESLVISPNPTSSMVNVDLELSGMATVNIQLLELSGRVLQSQQYRSLGDRTAFDLQDYAVGMYIVKVQVDTDVTFQKIILAK